MGGTSRCQAHHKARTPKSPQDPAQLLKSITLKPFKNNDVKFLDGF